MAVALKDSLRAMFNVLDITPAPNVAMMKKLNTMSARAGWRSMAPAAKTPSVIATVAHIEISVSAAQAIVTRVTMKGGSGLFQIDKMCATAKGMVKAKNAA